jgi:hypothetical protein
MQTSLSTIRMVAHNLKITAILKLPKLALCPLSPLRHSLSRGEGVGGGELSTYTRGLNFFKGSIHDLSGLINLPFLNA